MKYKKIVVEDLSLEPDETKLYLFEMENFPTTHEIVSITIECPNTFVVTSVRNIVGGRFNVNFHNFHWEPINVAAIAHVLYIKKI